jgi:hypothetical protein
MSTTPSVAALNFSWPKLAQHVGCSIAVFVMIYVAIHKACRRHFSKTHPLCEDEAKSPKNQDKSSSKPGVGSDAKIRKEKGPSMSTKLATRVLSTINAIVCCVSGVVIMFDFHHDDMSDYFSGCGNGIDIFLCWLGGCVIGYLVADWLCDGVEDLTMVVHHVVGAVMLFTGCQPYIAGVVSHVYLMELSTIPLNISWYKLMFTKGKFESTATQKDKSSFNNWNLAFQLSFFLVRCIWCPLNFVRALDAFFRCHPNSSISLAHIPSFLPVASLFLVVVVQFVWLYKIAVAPMFKNKRKDVMPSKTSKD